LLDEILLTVCKVAKNSHRSIGSTQSADLFQASRPRQLDSS
jgi:hypothetical protein